MNSIKLYDIITFIEKEKKSLGKDKHSNFGDKKKNWMVEKIDVLSLWNSIGKHFKNNLVYYGELIGLYGS